MASLLIELVRWGRSPGNVIECKSGEIGDIELPVSGGIMECMQDQSILDYLGVSVVASPDWSRLWCRSTSFTSFTSPSEWLLLHKLVKRSIIFYSHDRKVGVYSHLWHNYEECSSHYTTGYGVASPLLSAPRPIYSLISSSMSSTSLTTFVRFSYPPSLIRILSIPCQSLFFQNDAIPTG